MKNTATTIEINPVIFTPEYISTHLLPVIQRPSNDEDTMKETFLDMELLFKVVLNESEDGLTTYRLSKALAKDLDLDMEMLKKFARETVSDTAICQSITELFGLPEEMEEMGMYVVSNTNKHLGAGTAFLCTEPLRNLAEKLGVTSLVVIPSSIHELIAVRADVADSDFLNSMIQEVNSSIVSDREQLSDHYYIYHADTDTFTF